MNPLIENYFEAEGAIVERLQNYMPELKGVYTPFNIGDMQQNSQPSPAVHVVYGGDRVASASQSAGQGTMKPINQRWMVVLAVRNPKAQLQNTSEIRVDAGILVPQLLNALQGWAPVKWMRPLERIDGPGPGFSPSFAYFPFLFEGRIIT